LKTLATGCRCSAEYLSGRLFATFPCHLALEMLEDAGRKKKFRAYKKNRKKTIRN